MRYCIYQFFCLIKQTNRYEAHVNLLVNLENYEKIKHEVPERRKKDIELKEASAHKPFKIKIMRIPHND